MAADLKADPNLSDEKDTSTYPNDVESTGGSPPPVVDEETESRILRKLDWRIIPLVMWIYLMNFMDRGTAPTSLPLLTDLVTDSEQLESAMRDSTVWRKTSV
jgi:hypothetical protein